jgi:hypothetical protein
VLTIELIKAEWALIVKNSLEVDKEIKPQEISKSFQLNGSKLTV